MEKESHPNPFLQSLDLLDRINDLKYNNRKLSDLSVDGYNVWMFFQNRIFFNDLKVAIAGKMRIESTTPSFKDWVSGLGSLFLSGAAVVKQLILRPKVIVYSVDRTNSVVTHNDARLNAVYRFLKKNKIPYVEYLHAIPGRTLFTQAAKRGRVAFYMRSIDFLFMFFNKIGLYHKQEVDISLIDFSTFSAEEEIYVKPIVFKYLQTIPLVEFKVRMLQRILSLTKPRIILSIDNPRDYNELVVAAKQARIPFAAFQHGHFTKYHVGWLRRHLGGSIVHPDRLYVWSNFWKQELLRLGTYFAPEEILVGGAAVQPESVLLHTTSISTQLSVLIPYEVDSIKSEVRKYIDIFLDAGFVVYFKVRTDLPQGEQLALSLLQGFQHKNLFIVEDIKPIIAKVTVVAGTYSTFLYDMIVYQKPVALLETANDFGNGMVENGLAEMVNLENAIGEVKRIASTTNEVLEQRFEKLFDKHPKSLDETLQSIGKEYSLI